jgi:hypothetical protein
LKAAITYSNLKFSKDTKDRFVPRSSVACHKNSDTPFIQFNSIQF